MEPVKKPAKTVFADTLYWIAVTNPHDQWNVPAKEATKRLGKVFRLTTDAVLTEFLGHLSKRGEHLRSLATAAVRQILRNPNVKVLPQTRDLFLQGLGLYENRDDKDYSLTDCISMIVMRSEGVTEILTNDNNFKQEGFEILIRQ